MAFSELDHTHGNIRYAREITRSTLHSKKSIRNPYYIAAYPIRPLGSPPHTSVIDKSNCVRELHHPQNGNVAIIPIRKLVVYISQTTKNQ